MKYRHFLPYSLAATSLWTLITGTVGYGFGEYWEALISVARSVGYGFVFLVALLVALYVYRRIRRRSMEAARKGSEDEA